MQAYQNRIEKWLKESSAQAPLILTGTNESTLSSLINFARQVAVCKQGDTACTTCTACQQAMGGLHPDVITVGSDEKTIHMEEVKAVVDSAHTTSLGERRLIVIPRAERLSASAISALLKTFEEPAEGTRYLLTTQYKRRLLPTILSRCIIMALHEVPGKSVDSLPAWPQFGLKKDSFSEDDLRLIAQSLSQRARTGSSIPLIRRAMARLTDYYKIKSVRGNEKLAQEVLLATLSQVS